MSAIQNDVVGIGSVLIDQQSILPAYPEVDTKTEILNIRFQIGGPVPTALVLLRRFGRKCAFVGTWADDSFGRDIETDLQNEGLTLLGRCVPGAQSGFSQVWIERSSGSRTIAFSRGTCGPLAFADLPIEILKHTRFLHLDGWSGEVASRGAQIVKASGGKVVLDAGGLKPGMSDIIEASDVVICSPRFIGQFLATDDFVYGARKLLKQGPSAVVVTRGEHGAHVFTHSCELAQEIYPTETVDTTGAGDVFAGAFIEGLFQGLDWGSNLKFACAAASIKCSKYGNRDALPSLSNASSKAGVTIDLSHPVPSHRMEKSFDAQKDQTNHLSPSSVPLKNLST